MTLPMTKKEKIKSKDEVLQSLKSIFNRIIIARNCLWITNDDDFKSEHLVIAKNMMVEAAEEIQKTEHQMHEIIDAPLLENTETLIQQ
jgi:hypothetical protein